MISDEESGESTSLRLWMLGLWCLRLEEGESLSPSWLLLSCNNLLKELRKNLVNFRELFGLAPVGPLPTKFRLSRLLEGGLGRTAELSWLVRLQGRSGESMLSSSSSTEQKLELDESRRLSASEKLLLSMMSGYEWWSFSHIQIVYWRTNPGLPH